MTIYLPIIIYENGDISVFNSKKAAEEYLEPYDIDELSAFDCKGNKLKLVSRIEWKQVLGFQTDIENVVIEEANDTNNEIEELRQILIEFLSRVRDVNHKTFPQENWNDYATPKLVKKVSEIALIE